VASAGDANAASDKVLAAARYQGRRLAEISAKLVA